MILKLASSWVSLHSTLTSCGLGFVWVGLALGSLYVCTRGNMMCVHATFSVQAVFGWAWQSVYKYVQGETDTRVRTCATSWVFATLLHACASRHSQLRTDVYRSAAWGLK